MEVYKKYLNPSYMTRSMEKLKDVKYIVIHSALEKDNDVVEEFEKITSLSFQDEIYYSVHYIIGKEGKCLQSVPEAEVTYSTNNIELNYHVISIECCYEKESGEFNNKTVEMLVKLLSNLKQKYNLSNSNILLCYDLTGTRCPKFYIDNRFKFYDILEKVNENKEKEE